jgi:type II secretion system protein H
LKSTPPTRGFTLVEALIVVVLIGIVAAVAIPVLRSHAPSALSAAAAEAASVLRAAVSDAQATGRYVLVDASAPGQLRLHASNAAGAIVGALNDPLTKAPMELDTSTRPWRDQVQISALFLQGGIPYPRLLIGPAGQLQVFEGAVNRGPLESGSGLLLTAGTASAMVGIDVVTGRVTLQ